MKDYGNPLPRKTLTNPQNLKPQSIIPLKDQEKEQRKRKRL